MPEPGGAPRPDHVCSFTRERLHRLEATVSGDFVESRVVRARFCECGQHRVSDRRADVGLVRSPRRQAAPEQALQVGLALSEGEKAVVRALLRLAKSSVRPEAGQELSGPDLPGRLRCSAKALLRAAPPAFAKLMALDGLLSRLARQGLCDLVYRRQEMTRPLELREVLVSPAICEALAGPLGVRRPGAVDRETLTFMEGIHRRLAELAKSKLTGQPEALPWADLADRHRGTLEVGGSPDLTTDEKDAVLARGGTRKYRQLWLAVTEALEALSRGEDMLFRELSVRATGDSKSLAALRGDLVRLGVSLEDWGIFEHQPILRALGPVEYRLPGCRGTLRLDAVADYACLTLRTVSGLQIIRSGASAVLIVENLTPFEALAREDRQRFGGVLALYAGGFIGRAETVLLHKVLAVRPVPGFIWTDLDLGGHRIFVAVERVFREHGQPLTRIGAAPEFIDRATTGIPLTAEERAEMERLIAKGGILDGEAQWLRTVLARGAKVEQEAQLTVLRQLLEREPGLVG